MAVSKKTLLKVDLWTALRLGKDDPAASLVAVKKALANGSSPNDGYATWVPLGWAIRNQSKDIARCLIHAGADVNVIENGQRLLSRCLQTAGMEDLAQELIAHGAKPSPAILRVAAKRANEKIVRWALKEGLSPNDLSKSSKPVFAYWPAKKPVPKELIAASFHGPIEDAAAKGLAEVVIRRKNKELLDCIVEHGKVSADTKDEMLKSCLSSAWREGVDRLLAAGLCDPNYETRRPSPIVSCAPWISRKSPRVGLEVLEKLIAHGYSVNSGTHLPSGSPAAFTLLRTTKTHARPALLSLLVKHGLNPVATTPQGVHTLAHVLIAGNEWGLLGSLSQVFPGVQWEQEGALGLLATWAKGYKEPGTKPTYGYNPNPVSYGDLIDPEESLDIVMSLPGFDLQRRDASGHTGLRNLMQRTPGMNFERLTTRLIREGLNPALPDNEGVSDLDHLEKIKITPELRASFHAATLLWHGQPLASSSSGSARRL